MSRSHSTGTDTRARDRTPAIQRLLFVSDAAVADVDELPPAVRALIDAAGEVHVLTPTLPGRLAWLADDVDRFRHFADERLDTVLGHGVGIAELVGLGSVSSAVVHHANRPTLVIRHAGAQAAIDAKPPTIAP